MDDALNTAIARLADFRASFNQGDLVSDDPVLTADDLDLILAQLSWPEGDAPIR